jgi:hypothetical protein
LESEIHNSDQHKAETVERNKRVERAICGIRSVKRSLCAAYSTRFCADHSESGLDQEDLSFCFPFRSLAFVAFTRPALIFLPTHSILSAVANFLSTFLSTCLPRLRPHAYTPKLPLDGYLPPRSLRHSRVCVCETDCVRAADWFILPIALRLSLHEDSPRPSPGLTAPWCESTLRHTRRVNSQLSSPFALTP